MKKTQIYFIEKLKANELYSLSISSRNTAPTSQKVSFPSLSFTWKDIYILPCIVTINTRIPVFQYKVLTNTLYLNKHLYISKLSDTKLCSFCNQEDETIIHLFANCSKIKTLWNSLKEFFKDTFNLPSLTPQSAIFGFLQTDQELFIILNYFFYFYLNTTYVFQDVLKPFHLQPLEQILRKRMFWKKIFPNMMKRRNDFSSKSGVKFQFISKLVITFIVGGVWVYF